MFMLRLIARNVFRHKLRALLTITGVAVAILAFGLLRTLVGLWYLGVESSSASRLITRNAISLVFFLPISYKDKIRHVPGVKIVSYGSWFGGIYISEKNFFASFSVEPASYLQLYPEFVLPPDQQKAFIRDRKGAVVGRPLAERFGWQVGDTVILKGTIYPGEWAFTLRGIFQGAHKNVDERQFFFHWDYVNETIRKTVPRRADLTGFYMIGLTNPDQAATVSAAIDGLFKNSLAETLTETERAFQMGFVSMTEAIITAIEIVSYMVILIIMVVTANTMAMTARERIAEYATLKTMGFGARHIAGIIWGESLALSLAGGAIGIILTFPAARWVESALSQFFPFFHVSAHTVYLDLAAAAIVGTVAAIFPTWRGATIRIAEGLRRIA